MVLLCFSRKGRSLKEATVMCFQHRARILSAIYQNVNSATLLTSNPFSLYCRLHSPAYCCCTLSRILVIPHNYCAVPPTLNDQLHSVTDRQTDWQKGRIRGCPFLWPRCIRCRRAVSGRDLIPGGEVNGPIEAPLWLTGLPLPLCPEGDRQCGSSRIFVTELIQ